MKEREQPPQHDLGATPSVAPPAPAVRVYEPPRILWEEDFEPLAMLSECIPGEDPRCT